MTDGKVDYRAVLKAAEAFTDDKTPWDEKFKNLVAKSIKEQSDAFKLRFILQFEKQGLNGKEITKKINAAADMFFDKTQSGNKKNLKYGSVEFSDILKNFKEGENLTFVERKKSFKDFDLDGNGYIDLVEFLLFLYKEPVLDGYIHRNGLEKADTKTEAEALIKEFVNVPVFVDAKLDTNVLELQKLKAEYDVDVKAITDGATTEIKKRQLTNNLKAREKKYKDSQMSSWSDDQLGKAKLKLLKTQEKHLRDLEASIDKEAADALKPKKNLKMP